MMNTEKKTIRILLVDDVLLTEKVLRQILLDSSQSVDFIISSVGMLAMADEILRKEKFDVILLDLGLPDSEGIDTLRKLHTLHPDIPIIVFTGVSNEETGVQAIKEGAEDYLVKTNLSGHLVGRMLRYAIERKKMKQSLVDAHNELDQRIKERTAELAQANEKLKATVDQLVLSNIELQDFAHVVSHDLKTPIRGICTLANWLVTDYSDLFEESAREQVLLLAERARRMNRMIDGILQYSGVGRVTEKVDEIDLNDLVKQVSRDIHNVKDTTITIENTLPHIMCEKGRISQIFQNLLDNAVKYTDKPQGQIRIGCTEYEDYWRFYVADNGIGIEQKYCDRIFGLFESLDPKDNMIGTGLGLALVKKIVESYNGQIGVDSEIGIGSTFFFTLPKRERETANEILKANSAG